MTYIWVLLLVVPVFSLVHTKGGVGKTTSAVFLAAAAHQRGMDVVLVDADRQGSATEWADDATAAGDGLPFPVVSGVRLAEIDRSGLVIVDTPPGTASVIDEAISVADLVVVPSGASPLDLRRVWPTLEITAQRPTAVLLTGLDLRTRLAEEVRALLGSHEVPVIATPIVRREALRRAYGTTPTHLYGYDDVLTELVEAITDV